MVDIERKVSNLTYTQERKLEQEAALKKAEKEKKAEEEDDCEDTFDKYGNIKGTEDEQEMWDHGKKMKCTRCKEEQAIDNFNDKAVCEDCYDELEEEDDDDDDRDYSGDGINLGSLIMGFVILMITLTIGTTIVSTMRDAVINASTTTASNQTMILAETLGSFGSSFPFIFIFLVAIPALILMTRVFYSAGCY